MAKKTLLLLSGCTILMFLFVSCMKEGMDPAPDFRYKPESGSKYNIYYFDASTTIDPDNSTYSLKYRWDFDGDGQFDTQLSNLATASYRFPSADCFQTTLEVVDPAGNVSQIQKEICVDNRNNAPFAVVDIMPPIASLGTVVSFSASRSFDFEDAPKYLQVRWDFDGDSIWDTDYSVVKDSEFQYETPGLYIVRMEIIDSQGQISLLVRPIEVANTYNEYSYLTDPRDGVTYGIVKIGNQWVMAQNLVYGTWVHNYETPLNNGICEVFAYQDQEASLNNYGSLYYWGEIMDYSQKEGVQGFCPPGWHLPSDEEWKVLERSMGMEPELIDTIGWDRGPGIGTQLKKGGLSGFEGGLWGYRYPYRFFNHFGAETGYWSSTMESDGSVWIRGLSSWSTGVFRAHMRNNYAYSVRCFKDH